MEAMWTHFFPAMLKMKELIREGAIGEVRMMDVKFNFRSGWNPEGRLLNPDLAGGGLLDVGVYDIAFAQMVMGTAPSEIISSAHLGETGVDEQAGIVFKYSNGALAVLTCAVRTSTPHTASVYGTEGWIEVPPLFWQPDRFVLHTDEKNEEFAFERLGNGYSYEAQHVHECLKEDKKESDIIPHSLSVDVMKAMDEIRSQWNLRYPFE